MAIGLVVNGNLFNYPETSDQSWGNDATGWANAVTSGMLQKAGGLFTLTADVNFGPSFGLKSVYYKSLASVIAQSGVLRLANADTIAFRNVGNTADLTLGINGSNQLVFNGIPISSGTTAFSVANTATISPALNNGTLTATIVGSSITAAQISGTAAIPYASLSLGTSIQNSDISNTAAISVNKLGTLSPSVAVVTNGSGQLSTGLTTATELSYVHGVTSSIQTQLGTLLPITGGTLTGEAFYNGTPSTGTSLVNKNYVTTALGSAGYGSVTSVVAGTGLTGGTITTTGTIALGTTGVTAGSYQSVTVNALGQVTAGSNLTFGTDLTNSSGTLNLATQGSVTAGTGYNQFNVNSKGIITAASTQPIGTGSVVSVTAGNGLAGGVITSAGTISVPANGITYGLIQKVVNAAGGGALLGGTSASSPVQEIILGPGLSISSGTLNVTGTAGGTVTEIVAGAGLTGGTITGAGTVALDPTQANTWSGLQSFTDLDFALLGSTSGSTIVRAAAAASGTVFLPTSGTLGTGTVTSLTVTGSNGITLTGSPITTSGTIALTLGAITPTSITTSGTVSTGALTSTTGSFSGAVTTGALTSTTGTFSSNLNVTGTIAASNLSGTNTGNQTITLTGDVTGSGTGSFAATLGSVVAAGTYNQVVVGTKGLVTSGTSISSPTYHGTTFTSTGTFTTPSNSGTNTVYKFILTGGGGGAAGGAYALAGAGGATCIYYASGISASTAITITIGTGGAHASSSTTAGTLGGNSSFTIGTTTVTAGGGNGGGVSTTYASGGQGTNGNLNIAGGDTATVSTSYNSKGGATIWGEASFNGASASPNSQTYGVGGCSFAGTTNTGQSGAPGVCTIEWVL